MSGRRSSIARKFGQSRRHWPMSNGVWPKLRACGSSWRMSVRWLSQHCSEHEPMLKYTRWIASSAPIESSPPLRMWCTVSLRARLQPALAVAAGLAPALLAVGRRRGARCGLAPLDDVFVAKGRPLAEVVNGVDRARVRHLVGRDRGSVGRAGPRVRVHLVLERVVRHPGPEQLGDAQVLVADRALDVLPLRLRRIGRGIQRIERDVARAAGRADQERRLDRAVGEPAHARIGRLGIGGHSPAEALPAREAAVQLLPAGTVEARVGKLAIAERAGRGAEREIARRLALVFLGAVRIARVDRRVAEVARRVAVTFAADELEQLLVAGTPVETVRFFEALGRAALGARFAAAGIVDQAVRGEPVVALVGTQHAEPVDQDADPLLEDVGVEAGVAAGRLVPDLPPGDLGRREACLAGVEPGVVR